MVGRSSAKMEPDQLVQHIRGCTLCADRFAATATGHAPRPVPWFASSARLLIAGQAPGLRVHDSGRPFTDPSGDRLRQWLGLSEAQFYDRARVAIVPMAFCFPGYDTKKSDLPPPKICAQTWHRQVMAALPNIGLRLLVGGAAQRWHLGTKTSVTETVQGWRALAPDSYPLPHPSWRNTAWIKKNPWFEAELLPDLRARVKELME
ncbi:Uracil DNA glycosylase superfamily protein [Tritonibacter multivorans]|uniref:Uracil DNA glycosylase superfamily protein n=1 Tax=Tritonibacter multivorans TaxID=928856 RepID=A0A0P1G4M5_9RHOB|nr:uracil-DNA glycosylase family protein [Tritonibacter multivorans]MDA7421827.1 uracil-DNA glycosylase family protein [Tritonibacter multivorans]CUH76799.1 Uracil DNA glycosylase superfamily protein [Tritonibacter multivorans]SFD06712.1 Uracil-DNA glycosylase [Tritonibacter multivorans]